MVPNVFFICAVARLATRVSPLAKGLVCTAVKDYLFCKENGESSIAARTLSSTGQLWFAEVFNSDVVVEDDRPATDQSQHVTAVWSNGGQQ